MIDNTITGFSVYHRNVPIECIVELNYKDFIIYLHSAYKSSVRMRGGGMTTFMRIRHLPSGSYCYDNYETFQEAIEAIDSDYNNSDTENE